MAKSDQEDELFTPQEELILKEWYKQRRETLIIAYLQKTIFTFEYASVAISALFYLKNTIKPNDPIFFYSITMGVIYLTASFSAVYGGRYVDRTGRLRQFALVVILSSITGNLIYIIPYSEWFPVLGRALCGITDGVQPGISGKKLNNTFTKPRYG